MLAQWLVHCLPTQSQYLLSGQEGNLKYQQFSVEHGGQGKTLKTTHGHSLHCVSAAGVTIIF